MVPLVGVEQEHDEVLNALLKYSGTRYIGPSPAGGRQPTPELSGDSDASIIPMR